jgi:hypothetical protein
MKRISLVLVLALQACSTTGNAPKGNEMKVDFVAGYSGEDRVIVADDNASIHSDRDAVKEYSSTVNVLNVSRQEVNGDLSGLAMCRRKKAEVKGVDVAVGPLSVPCMTKVVMDHERAGTDLMQVKGKLVLRKKDDFKARLEEANACVDQMNDIRSKAREAYMLEGCAKVMEASITH